MRCAKTFNRVSDMNQSFSEYCRSHMLDFGKEELSEAEIERLRAEFEAYSSANKGENMHWRSLPLEK